MSSTVVTESVAVFKVMQDPLFSLISSLSAIAVQRWRIRGWRGSGWRVGDAAEQRLLFPAEHCMNETFHVGGASPLEKRQRGCRSCLWWTWFGSGVELA